MTLLLNSLFCSAIYSSQNKEFSLHGIVATQVNLMYLFGTDVSVSQRVQVKFLIIALDLSPVFNYVHDCYIWADHGFQLIYCEFQMIIIITVLFAFSL